MKRVLYVDFENVSSAGLAGVLKLTNRDEVKIFLGPKCSKMSLIEAESILHCDATVELIKNDQIGKNALDFIIMVHLGYDIAKHEGDAFFIISNDKGYEPAIHEMQSKTGETIERYPDIEHVIARKDQTPGLFARLFGKKKPVVENTTEHEVLRKGSRTGSNRTAGGRNGNGAGRSGSGAGNRNGNARGGAGNNRNGRGSSASNGSRNGAGAGNNRGDVGGASQPSNAGNAKNATGSRPNAGNGSRNGQKPGAGVGQGSAQQGNGQNSAKNAGQSNVQVSAAEKKAAVAGKNPNATQKQAVQAAKNVEQGKKSEAPVASKPKVVVTTSTKPGTPITFTTQDDSYLDNLSIADLRAQLNVTSAASAADIAASVSGSKNEKSEKNEAGKPAQAPKPAQQAAPKRPASSPSIDMTDSERDLVARALAETDNLGDFHNYILKELHDNDRATEIYKAEKYKVGKK